MAPVTSMLDRFVYIKDAFMRIFLIFAFLINGLAAVDHPVELLNVNRYTVFKTNTYEYAGKAESTKAVAITFKINYPEGIVVKAVNVGSINIIANGVKKPLSEFADNKKVTWATFDADKYRRLYGEILNKDLLQCTVDQVIIFDVHDFPVNFDIEINGFGVNEVRSTYVFKDIGL
jgi:hypothetical protein